MKRSFLVTATCLLFYSITFAQAKYVFFFIGDGMGIGSISITESILSTQQGKHEKQSLSFSSFPIVGIAHTFSASNLVTCSSAAGTALATGNKTRNGRLGVNEEATANFTSIAERFKQQGYKVGITTSVSIDHATPAAFYAHQPSRRMHYEIGKDLCNSNFDFFCGSGFLEPQSKRNGSQENLFDLAHNQGYSTIFNLDEARNSSAQKLIVLQPHSKPVEALPYAIDKDSSDYTLSQITQLAIDKLFNKKGFFLMVEGGKIDWAGHNNDAGAMVGEVIEFSNAVKVALAFLKKYPKETLIVVTADHETGGLSLGASENKPTNNSSLLMQVSSVQNIEKILQRPISFSTLKLKVEKTYGVALSFVEENQLRKWFSSRATQLPTSDTANYSIGRKSNLHKDIARMMSRSQSAIYSTFEHTGSMVPIYAIGSGSELFNGVMDNTEIPKKIIRASRLKW
ncbi:MAG: alkaline phosphatase [Bacteroidales bacterium]